MTDPIRRVGIVFGTLALFALALVAATPVPHSDGSIPARAYVDAILPSLFFLGSVYLHNGKRHIVNVLLLTLIFFGYCMALGEVCVRLREFLQ